MITLPQAKNFLGLEERYADLLGARAAILPIPYEATTSYLHGSQHGPAAILTASQQVEFFDDELDLEPRDAGITTLEPLAFKRLSHEAALAHIRQSAARVMEAEKFLVSLGGEHSITIPLVQAANEMFDNLSVLQLDAHSDLRDSYEGSKFNHACVMARVNETCPFAGIGLRSGILGERKSIRKDARLVYAREMAGDSEWQDAVLNTLTDNVYLTIDLDFFDPAVMPAVGTPEPGGFNWYETLAFLRRVFREKHVVAADVVELLPMPHQIHADFFAAKLVYKLIAYKFYLTKK